MRRLADKGPRLVSPADFPSLVPSSPAGHASIYLGLGGPALVVADLAASGECALAQGFELVAAGEVDRVAVSASEERSAIVEQIFSALFGRFAGAPAPGVAAARREGAAAIAIAAAPADGADGDGGGGDGGGGDGADGDGGGGGARAPAERPLAEIAAVVAWTREREAASAMRELEALAPAAETLVVLPAAGGRAEAIVCGAGSPWAGCPRVSCAATSGAHEAAGGFAIAVAAARVARGDAPAALVVGTRPARAATDDPGASASGSGYAVLLRRWTS
jgi:3-oxoacyl-[acyl-carrier-protein] synthase II